MKKRDGQYFLTMNKEQEECFDDETFFLFLHGTIFDLCDEILLVVTKSLSEYSASARMFGIFVYRNAKF